MFEINDHIFVFNTKKIIGKSESESIYRFNLSVTGNHYLHCRFGPRFYEMNFKKKEELDSFMDELDGRVKKYKVEEEKLEGELLSYLKTLKKTYLEDEDTRDEKLLGSIKRVLVRYNPDIRCLVVGFLKQKNYYNLKNEDFIKELIEKNNKIFYTLIIDWLQEESNKRSITKLF